MNGPKALWAAACAALAVYHGGDVSAAMVAAFAFTGGSAFL